MPSSPPLVFSGPHLLQVSDLNRPQIEHVLDEAERLAAAPEPTRLTDQVVLNVFLEPSTRTRVSFEIAAKRLGAHVVNVTDAGASLAKGESLRDTLLTLAAMDPDILVLRHGAAGAAALAADTVGCPVINGGDGAHEHPTQALLDALALRRRWGTLEGRVVVICGDLKHSRVARSSCQLLHHLGARVHLVAPPTLIPEAPETWGAETVETDFDTALSHADAVMMLRVQRERMAEGLMPALEDYRAGYALTAKRFAQAPLDMLVLHPGPQNRGVEIDSEAADDPTRSLIREQVAAGVAVRMAVLALVAGTPATVRTQPAHA